MPVPQPKDDSLFDVGSLMAVLNDIDDPRVARGVRYSLPTLLVLLILAKLAGEDSMKGMSEWVRLRRQKLAGLLNLPRATMPHQTTYERVLAQLNEIEFEYKLGQYFARQAQLKDGQALAISIDGKVLRGTIPLGETKLLDYLDLTGCVITGDAMFTQRDLCIQIVEAGGQFVLSVKANQKTLQHAIADAFAPADGAKGHQPIGLDEAFVCDTSIGHGRIETRYI